MRHNVQEPQQKKCKVEDGREKGDTNTLFLLLEADERVVAELTAEHEGLTDSHLGCVCLCVLTFGEANKERKSG